MTTNRSNVQLFTSFSLVIVTVVLGLWLNENTAHAVVSPNQLDAKTAPASLCYIEMWNGSTDDPSQNSLFAPPSSACSGTLISDNRVLTAAHCIPAIKAAERNRVTCGGGSVFTSINGYAANPNYQNTNNSDDTHDVAVLDLNSPQKPGSKHYIKPMVLAATQTQIDTILNTPANCTLWGYGRDDASATDNSWGTLRGANIDYLTPSLIQTDTGWLDSPQDIYIGPDTHAGPGDSGGPIVCQAADGSPIQIATTMTEGQTTKGPLPVYSVHEMMYFNIDWINSQIALNRLPNN